MLDVRFYNAPELDLQVPVRSDGKISLQLIGDVPVAGYEPSALSEALTQRYESELENPRVTVIVREFGGSVYVGGEVGAPGAVPFGTGMTVLQAINTAGGFLKTANLTSVILIRWDGERFTGYRLAMEAFLAGEGGLGDATLQPSDIVHVPKSKVANVNQFVDMYIRQNIPIPISIPLPAF